MSVDPRDEGTFVCMPQKTDSMGIFLHWKKFQSSIPQEKKKSYEES